MVVPRKRQLSKEAVHQVAMTTVVNVIALFLVGFNAWVGININRLASNGDEARGLIAGWSVVLLFVILRLLRLCNAHILYRICTFLTRFWVELLVLDWECFSLNTKLLKYLIY